MSPLRSLIMNLGMQKLNKSDSKTKENYIKSLKAHIL